MDHHAFCPLCGVWVKTDYPPVSPKLKWLENVRAVRHMPPVIGLIEVTPKGYLAHRARDTGGLHAVTEDIPWGGERHYLNDPHSFDAELGRSFAMHDACYELLLLRERGMPKLEEDEECCPLPSLLFDQFYAAEKGISWEARGTYGGASQFQYGEIRENPALICQSNGYAFLVTDPMDLDSFLNSDEPEVAMICSDDQRPPAKQAEDTFSRLPTEIIHGIAIELTSPDVCQFRLASRTAAIAGHPVELPQEFWRSRFFPENEFGFLSHLLVDSQPGMDWRRLYTRVGAALTSKKGFESLRNRQRIWLLLGELLELYRLVNKNFGFARGPSMPESEFRVGTRAHLDCYVEDVGQMVGGEIFDYRPQFGIAPKDRMSSGSVLLPERPTKGGYFVCVSTAPFCGQNYVSGVRLQKIRKRSCDWGEQDAAGFVNGKTEMEHYVHPDEVLKAIELAILGNAIIGMKLVVGGQTERLSDWMGADNIENNKKVTFNRLAVSQGSQITGLTLGFEKYHTLRVVLMAILERSTNTSTREVYFPSTKEPRTPLARAPWINGPKDKLKTISIRFQHQLISGLTFKFESKTKRVIGYNEGTKIVPITPRNATLVRMDIAWGTYGKEDGPVAMQFHFLDEAPLGTTTPATRRIENVTRLPETAWKSVDVHIIDPAKNNLASTPKAYDNSVHRHEFSCPPGATFGGLWASDRPRQRSSQKLPEMGVFYEATNATGTEPFSNLKQLSTCHHPDPSDSVCSEELERHSTLLTAFV